MKTLFSALVLLASISSFAAESPCPSGFWDEVKKVAENHVNGTGDIELVGNSARFVIDGRIFDAEIVESPDSDGGDLNDVFFRSEDGGCEAELRNVPAYGSLLRAMGVEIDD